jgi:hypothetical protein
LWPTPTAQHGLSGTISEDKAARYHRKYRSGSFVEAIAGRIWPTPSATDYKGSSTIGQRRRQLSEAAAIGGQLNPTWVEWLMGFPIGWTDSAGSGTLLSRNSSNGSDAASASGSSARRE